MEFGLGLLIRRREAMRLAYTNKPEGNGYCAAFGQLPPRYRGKREALAIWPEKVVRTGFGYASARFAAVAPGHGGPRKRRASPKPARRWIEARPASVIFSMTDSARLPF